ncbi:MAG: peptidylprolyl isomerase [Candidatus Cloacimonetes bacterium]|nr:peptidylprolyl isomerase [Candidatus Cloacimonadota bacterium]
MKVWIIPIILILGGVILAAENPIIIMKTNYGEIEIELFPEVAPLTVENFIELAEGTKEWKDPNSGNMVKKPFYDGLIFHRVIKNFMIQGGCPLGTGTGGPGYRFADEFPGEQVEITGTIKDQAEAQIVYNDILLPYLQTTNDPDEQMIALQQQCYQNQSTKPLVGIDVDYLRSVTGYNNRLTVYKLQKSVDYGTLCMANSGPDTNGSQFFIVTLKDGCSWLNGKHTVFGEVIKGMDVAHNIENLPTDKGNRPLPDVTPVIESIRRK